MFKLSLGLRKFPRKDKENKVVTKMMKLVKIMVLGIAVVTKICLILKFIHTMLKFKYLAIATGYLILSGVKLWLFTKQQKQPPKVVYYSHSAHGLDHEDEDWSGETWKRKIGIGEHDHDAQEMAFARHKPSSYELLHNHEGIY